MEIVNKNSLQVVGFQVTAEWDYLFIEIPHTWNMLFRRFDEIRNKVDNKCMDISVRKEGKLYTQLICVEVGSLSFLPTGMIGFKFPTKKYISATHKGTFIGIAESYEKMISWADENGYKPGDFKIDYGYFPKEKEPIEHTLYLALNKKP